MNYYEKGNLLIICGGRCDAKNNDHSILNDLHALRLDSLTWLKIESYGEELLPKANHCSVMVKSRLVIFGGYTKGFVLNNDV